ncbi:MAG: uracil-DNA glycosylase [Acidobacteria bacterium]|nr:MAG: uracil-DNA glycosylase [Acidobacteriota bacterium]
MAKVLDEQSRRAVAARVQYYRDLGIFELYKREIPEGMSFGQAISREELARVAEESPVAVLTQDQVTVAEPAGEVVQLADILNDKPAALRVIREEIGDCTRCKLCEGRTNIVFGVGDAHARIMFVGEGPGADEDAQGEPFVGRAGQLLNNMITAMGIRREDVYIGNVVKCRPPKNRAPEPDESATCGPFLMRQISVVRPEVIVALGATAAKFLLGASDSLGNLRGHIYDFRPDLPQGAPERDPDFTTKLVVTYHPAYLLRDPRQKKEAWLDLQIVMKYLGMPMPKREAESNPERRSERGPEA